MEEVGYIIKGYVNRKVMLPARSQMHNKTGKNLRNHLGMAINFNSSDYSTLPPHVKFVEYYLEIPKAFDGLQATIDSIRDQVKIETQ